MMKNNAYTGISFPFRLSVRGGVAMSSTSPNSPQHIEEGLRQLISTKKKQRVMEANFGNTIYNYLLEYQDESLYGLIKYELIQLLEEQENRIRVDQHSTTVYGVGNTIYAEIHYSIDKYEEDFILSTEV